MAEPRRTFGPVVLVGLAAGLVVALGGNRGWVAVDSTSDAGLTLTFDGSTGTMPLAGALGYVLLAAWGVLLVARGRVRRAVAVLGLLTAMGALVTCLAGYWSADDSVRAELATLNLDHPSIHHTPWFWVTAAAAVVAVVATAAAVRWAPTWPEMGGRYDAPGSAPPVEAAEDPTGLDLWRALDQGHDPTVRPDSRTDP